jgi:lambda family phage portal protein
MWKFLNRLAKRGRERSFEAAAGGRRWADAALATGVVPVGLATVRNRAQSAVRNSPWAARAVQAWATSLVAETGLRPQSMHPSPDRRREIDDLFAACAEQCDAAGRTTFAGLQAVVCRSLVEAGEAFVRLRYEDGLKLQVLDPAQVDANAHADRGGGVRIRAGIEFDALGRRTAYRVLPDPPGEPFATSLQPVRVEAADVCHVYEALSPGQVRGISWLAPVLLKLRDLDAYSDAQLMRQKVGALHAGFLYSPDGSAGPYGGEQTGSALESGLEPGVLKVLPSGFDVKFSDPPELGAEYDAFQRWCLREIASGLGLPFELLSGDLSAVNYSSIRAGLVEFRRRVDTVRNQVLVPLLLAPVWRRFIELAVLTGALPADDPEIGRVTFISPRWHWVDPLKDAEAEVLAIRAGLRSRAEIVAEHGRDIEEVDRERAEDRRRERALSLDGVEDAAA